MPPTNQSRNAGGNTVSGDRTPAQMLSYFQELAGMVKEIWSDTPQREWPKIIGPDGDFHWGYSGIDANSTLKAMVPSKSAFTPIHD